MNFKYSLVLAESYFEDNKCILREWMFSRNLQYLWTEIRRANFINYKIFFDNSEDYIAFRLTFAQEYKE